MKANVVLNPFFYFLCLTGFVGMAFPQMAVLAETTSTQTAKNIKPQKTAPTKKRQPKLYPTSPTKKLPLKNKVKGKSCPIPQTRAGKNSCDTTPGSSIFAGQTFKYSNNYDNNPPQSVVPSVSGLPGGAKATFDPSPVKHLQSTDLTITTKTSTPPGKYELTFSPVEAGWRIPKYILTILALKITGEHKLWYFDNLGTSPQPANYPNQQTLSISKLSPLNAGYRWRIIQSLPGKVSFSPTSLSSEILTVSSSITVYSLRESAVPEDVTVTVEVKDSSGTYSLPSEPFPLTVYAPRRMIFDKQINEAIIDNNPDGKVWKSSIYYKLQNQFCKNILETPKIPIGESFDSGLVDDSPNNWTLLPRNKPEGGMWPPQSIKDTISTASLSLNPVPTPIPPSPVLSKEKIFHFSGQVFAGTTESGFGTPIQFHTWQYYLDHGAHEKIVQPECFTG